MAVYQTSNVKKWGKNNIFDQMKMNMMKIEHNKCDKSITQY